MAVRADRIVFKINQLILSEAFEAFREPENQHDLKGRLGGERVEIIVRLTQLFLDEFISNREWSLEVYGWLCRLIHHIGDEHALSFVFSDHELLRLKILNPDNYQVLFNGVEVGRAHKLSIDDPEGTDEPAPREDGGVADSPTRKIFGSELQDGWGSPFG